MTPLRFTLVTSAHVTNNPRLVKEADALTAAGHVVRVVAPLHHEHLARRDDALLASRRWRLQRVPVGRASAAARWAVGVAAQRAARTAFALGLRAGPVADRALARNAGAMLRAAAAEPADVVIGHNLQALPVAGRAARLLGARLGFDIEDLHSGELRDAPEDALQRRVVAAVESRWLSRCDFLTASSEGIATEIASMYGVTRPTVVLNVFPLTELDHEVALDGERPSGARVSLYWYSQVVGAGRGIEEALLALAQLPTDVHLSLRGERDATFASWMDREARRLGIEARVHLAAPVPADELVVRASAHDIGLALEQPTTRNRQLCVTNKIFTYLLAGIAVAATDTEGQRGVMREAAGAGFLHPAGDADALARGLSALAAHPDALGAAKRRAREAALRQFHWERERDKLVRLVTRSVGG